MSTSTHKRLSHSVQQQLDSVRRAIRTYIALDGVLMAVLWALLVFWLGGILDYFPVTLGSSETPKWLRAALLAALLAGVAWALLWRAGRRVFARLPDRSLAVLVERRFPELNNELVTAVELIGQPEQEVSNPAAYRAMLDRVHSTVSSRVGTLPTADLLNWQPIWTIGVAAGLLVFVSILAAIGMPIWMSTWAKRFFALSSENWPRRAALRAEGVRLQLPAFTGQLASDRALIPFESNVVRVPRGSAATLQIAADAGAAEVPTLCTLFYRGSDGSRGRANMRRVGGTQSGWQLFTLEGPPLDGLSSDLDFDVVGSDARLRDYKLVTIDPAVMNVVELECRYPPYLLDSLSSRPASEVLAYRNGLVIPEGTDVTLHGTASNLLSRVQYVLHGGGATTASSNTGSSNTAPTVEIRECRPNGAECTIPLGVLRSSLVVEIRPLDRFGLSADQIPRYLLNVVEDSMPEVQTHLAGIGLAVTSRAILPIKGTITDDYGVSRIWSELSRNDLEPLTIDLPLSADNKVDSAIDLLQLAEQRGAEIKPGITLGLTVSAQDHYNLNGQQHVAQGQSQQLAVVTDDKLLVILDRQELELRQRLELIISELGQLREALLELSKLKFESLSAAKRRARKSVSAMVISPLPVSTEVSGLALATGVSLEKRILKHRWLAPNPLKDDGIGLPPAFSSSKPRLPSGSWAANNSPREYQFASNPFASQFVSTREILQDDAADKPVDDQAQQLRRLATLRAQQSVLQADKSQQELLGIANRIDDIRQQLVNNRIDSRDRQERLQKRVYEPLKQALGNEVEELRRRLGELQSATMTPEGGSKQASAAIDSLNRLLSALEEIKANMMDIESYNEIIDLVRGLLEDEERLLEETRKQQKKQILDILK